MLLDLAWRDRKRRGSAAFAAMNPENGGALPGELTGTRLATRPTPFTISGPTAAWTRGATTWARLGPLALILRVSESGHPPDQPGPAIKPRSGGRCPGPRPGASARGRGPGGACRNDAALRPARTTPRVAHISAGRRTEEELDDRMVFR